MVPNWDTYPFPLFASQSCPVASGPSDAPHSQLNV